MVYFVLNYKIHIYLVFEEQIVNLKVLKKEKIQVYTGIDLTDVVFVLI